MFWSSKPCSTRTWANDVCNIHVTDYLRYPCYYYYSVHSCIRYPHIRCSRAYTPRGEAIEDSWYDPTMLVLNIAQIER